MLPPALETALTPLARVTCKPLHDRIKKAASQCSDRGAATGRYLLAGITAPIISKMEDFTMLGYTAYQFSIVGPFALVCFFGAAVMWFSGIR